jgi:hypothetical protein
MAMGKNNPPAEVAAGLGESPSLTIGSLDCRISRSHLWRARQIIECCLDGGSPKTMKHSSVPGNCE